MKWIIPQLEYHWPAVQKYPEAFPTKEDWLKRGKKGRVVKIQDHMVLKVANYNPIISLEAKRKISNSFEKGFVEMPIVFKKKDESMELFSGNGEMAYAVGQFYQLSVWVIDI